MIAPEENGNFVANMERVLDVYKRPFDEKCPVVCMDESPKQLIGETKTPIAASPGQVAKYDYEYKRHGVCNVFMASEPLAGKRLVKITERKTKIDWAYFLEDIVALYTDAEKLTLVMDNFNTHTPGYKTGKLSEPIKIDKWFLCHGCFEEVGEAIAKLDPDPHN